MTLRRLIQQQRGRGGAAVSPPDGAVGDYTGTGNQASANPVALGGTALTAAPTFGITYAPFNHVASFTANMKWLDSSDITDGLQENRLQTHGPHWAPEAGTLQAIRVALQRGDYAHAMRGVAYADNGAATTSMLNPISGAPAARVGTNAGAEATVAQAVTINGTTSASADTVTASAHGLAEGAIVYLLADTAGLAAGRYFVRNPTTNAFQLATTTTGGIANITTSVAIALVVRDDRWVTLPLSNEPIAADSFYWPTIYLGNVAAGAGARALMTIGGTATDRVRSNSGAPAYSSTAAPSATWPAVNRNSRRTWAAHFVYTPTPPPAPTILGVTANGDRSISLVGEVADARTPMFVQVEARPVGGAWATIRIAPVTSGAWACDHQDAALGTTYEYRATAQYKNASGPASAIATATPAGVRVAYVRATPSLLSDAAIEADPSLVQSPWRGLHGSTSSLYAAGVPLYITYNRNQLLWRETEPSAGGISMTPWNDLLDALGDDQILHARFRTTADNTTLPSWVPSQYVILQNGEEFPDLRQDYMLNASGTGRIQRWIAGMAAGITSAGVPLRNDPRLGCLDMGVRNKFGEWTGNNGGITVPVERSKWIIDAVCQNFPNTPIIMSLADEEEVLYYALTTYPNVIGVRQDALGDLDSPYMEAQLVGDRSPRLRRILTDPLTYVVAEHKAVYGAAGDLPNLLLAEHDLTALRIAHLHNINLGASGVAFSTWPATNRASVLRQIARAGYLMQVEDAILPSPVANGNEHRVTLRWRNRGNGPLPINVSPTLQLRNAGGAVAQEWTLGLNLRTLRPGAPAADYTDRITVSGVTPGSGYKWAVQIKASGRRPAIRLGNSGVQSGVWYELPVAGGVTVS